MPANQPTALVAADSFGMGTVTSPLPPPPDTQSGDFRANPPMSRLPPEKCDDDCDHYRGCARN